MFSDLGAIKEDWAETNEDYDAKRSQFRVLRNRMAAARLSAAEDLIRLAMDARSAATAQDWTAMSKDLGE